ncbi:unnamed protein product [Closterium sp. Naga37s-1]|nr:unnamed protein product [Closterium sp. Naga37s-1]
MATIRSVLSAQAGAQQISFSATCQRRAQRQAVTPTASFPRNPAFRASAAPPSAHPSAFLGQQDSLRLRKASPSAVSPSAPRRRVSPVRAADGDSDVPAFKGFPPMQTRPAWYWRIAAVVPYLLPLCEAWIYSETAQSLFHFLFTYEQLCQPFLMLLDPVRVKRSIIPTFLFFPIVCVPPLSCNVFFLLPSSSTHLQFSSSFLRLLLIFSFLPPSFVFYSSSVFFLLPLSSTHLQFSSSFLCLLHPPFLSSRSLHLLPPLSPTLSIPASAPFHLTRSSRTADLPFVSEPLGPERAHAVVARANATWQLFVDQNVPAEPWAPPAAVLNGSFLESIWKRKYMGDCAPSSAIPVSQPAHLQQQQQAENAAQKAAAEAVSGALVEEKPANGNSTGAVITSTWGAAVVCCVMYHVREGVVAKQRGKEVCERKERDRKCGGRKQRGWRRGDDKK